MSDFDKFQFLVLRVSGLICCYRYNYESVMMWCMRVFFGCGLQWLGVVGFSIWEFGFMGAVYGVVVIFC